MIGSPGADHRIARDQRCELLFAPAFGSRRPLGEHQVADLRGRIPDAHLDARPAASRRTRPARRADRSPRASGRARTCTRPAAVRAPATDSRSRACRRPCCAPAACSPAPPCARPACRCSRATRSRRWRRLSSRALEFRIGPGLGDDPRAVVRADLGLVGLDQDVERRRIDVALFDQQRLERAHPQLQSRTSSDPPAAVTVVCIGVLVAVPGVRPSFRSSISPPFHRGTGRPHRPPFCAKRRADVRHFAAVAGIRRGRGGVDARAKQVPVMMVSRTHLAARRAMQDNADFYDRLPVFEGFANIMDPARYRPLPDDWLIGLTDVVNSTQAIAAGRYKSVNTAGAAVISAMGNALPGRKFPFVFGGDGASFAVPACDQRDRLGRAGGDGGMDARRARSHAAHRAGAGGRRRRAGLDGERRALRAVEACVVCDVLGRRSRLGRARDEGRALHLASRGARRASRSDRAIVSLERHSGDPRRDRLAAGHAGDPRRPRLPRPSSKRCCASWRQVPRSRDRFPSNAPDVGWPPPGAELEARASRRRGESLFLRRLRVLFWTLLSYTVMRTGMRVGEFDPAVYRREVVENSDFRKYDDNLRMTLDCTPALADRIERRLAKAAARQYRALRHASTAGRDHDLHRAVGHRKQPRSFCRRCRRRIRAGGAKTARAGVSCAPSRRAESALRLSRVAHPGFAGSA